jgi:hypothetical protein
MLQWMAAAAIVTAPAVAAHAQNYGYDDGHGHGRTYDSGYAGDEDSEYGGYGYGYGSRPYSAPARYCGEHLRYHLRQAWLNDNAPYNDWWGAGGPEGWHEAMQADHARFHYTHPGSWRCEYQGWPAG